jgi:peptidoglycan hydrolase FlgJ
MEKLPINKTVKPLEQSAPASRPGEKKLDREKLKKACSDFEALFLARMLKQMRQSIPQNGLLGNGPGKEIYQSLMDQELAKKISQRGGVGLGENLYRQVLQREEKSSAATREGQQEAGHKVEESESR